MARGERRRSGNRSSRRLAHSKKMASESLQDGVEPASKARNTSAPKKASKRPCRIEKQAKKQARYELSKCKVSGATILPVTAATTVGRHKAPRGGVAHIVTVTDDAQRTLQDGVLLVSVLVRS